MANDETPNYDVAIERLEEIAQEHLPGVLDLMAAYERTVPATATWRPINATVASYATGASESAPQDERKR